MSKAVQTPYSLVPYSCIFIDAAWRHFFTAAVNCLCTSCCDQKTEDDVRQRLCGEIISHFETASIGSHSLVCLSVRTAFDLFLRTKRFSAGSEVIMSAVNIPGMVDIVRKHGLVPVAWDIDADTLSPDAASLDSLITDRSVAVVVSHLFGKLCTSVDSAVGKAKKRGLFFIEDCAESFDVFGYLGHSRSDVVLFSFGVMKHFTAFGGAVCRVGDRGLYGDMKKLYASDPVQSRGAYFKKLCTTFVAAVGLNVPLSMRCGVPLAHLIGLDYKRRVVEMLRGFPPGEDIWLRLRRRPSTALLLTLRERLGAASESDLRKTKEKGEFVRRLLPQNGVVIPGRLANGGHDWLFPIVVDDAEAVARRLNSLGVDAVTKATQLTVVNCDPKDTTADGAKGANYLLDHVVYLPVHKNVPYEYLRRICKAVEVAVTPNRPFDTYNGQAVIRSKL